MPTPLPSIDVPDNMPTLNAYRVGQQDRIAADERSLLKQAGGLAAAGNYKGAQSALYAGGNFGEARNVAGELRAQSAEGRAQSSHLSAMKDHQLERASKVHELFGRLIPTIKTPEQLEMAKNLIKQRTGQDFSGVTMESLPMYHQENISTQQQIENELAERRMKAEQSRADLAQSNTNRSFGLQERQFDNTVQNQTDIRGIMQQRADNAASAAKAKAGTLKPLTESQANATSAYGQMTDAQDVLAKGQKYMVGNKPVYKGGVLPSDDSESPMSRASNFLAQEAPGSAITSAQLDKRQKQYIQSAMQWVRAKLRKESGATISPAEFTADYGIFFPQPGDDVQTRRNKARARKQVEKGFRAMTGAVPDNAPAQAESTESDSAFGHLSDDDLLKQLNE